MKNHILLLAPVAFFGCGLQSEADFNPTDQSSTDITQFEPKGPPSAGSLCQNTSTSGYSDPRDATSIGRMDSSGSSCCFTYTESNSTVTLSCYDCSSASNKCVPANISRSAALDIINPGNQNPLINVSYSLSLSAIGGTAPYTWGAAGLPPGLSINAATGVVSGTAHTGGQFWVTIGVSDRSSPIEGVNATFSWVVKSVVPNLTGLSPGSASNTLTNFGLGLGNESDVTDANCDDSVGVIIDQSPANGTVVPSGSVVNYTIAVRPSGTLHCN